MPYVTRTGNYERASRIGHARTVVEAMAEDADFHVPAEALEDSDWLTGKTRSRSDLPRCQDAHSIDAAIAVDGSYLSVEARPGLPSVRYGYTQVGAVFLDLAEVDRQRTERFVDPVKLAEAKQSEIFSMHLPAAGAYVRAGIDIVRSWREAIDTAFRSRRVERWTLLEMLMLLHGTPENPADTVRVNCRTSDCEREVPVPSAGTTCPRCDEALYATDVLRVHEEVVDEGTNESALGRLTSVVELLVSLGLLTRLWERSRSDWLTRTLFISDGPLAMFGTPAKLRSRALQFVQYMAENSGGGAPYVCGIEKNSDFADYARAIRRHDVMQPGDLMIVDQEIIAKVRNTDNPAGFGENTYWGRKFFYRALDGRVLVLTVPPEGGPPYDNSGGQPGPYGYPSLPPILDVIDRTGSSMYEDGIIPVALAHGATAYPIGVGSDVLKLVAKRRLGLDDNGNTVD